MQTALRLEPSLIQNPFLRKNNGVFYVPKKFLLAVTTNPLHKKLFFQGNPPINILIEIELDLLLVRLLEHQISLTPRSPLNEKLFSLAEASLS
jgi:hypothetical protein